MPSGNWNTCGGKPGCARRDDRRDSRTSRAAGSLVVPAVTIDETVEHLGLDRVDFVKMDIEGSERHALKGAHRTLSRFGPRMVLCIYHREDDPELIPQIVLEARPSYLVDTTRTQAHFY